jgi:hypothetical protein
MVMCIILGMSQLNSCFVWPDLNRVREGRMLRPGYDMHIIHESYFVRLDSVIKRWYNN